MKRTFLVLICSPVLMFGYGQPSADMNYILATDLLKKGVTPQTNLGSLAPSELRQTVQYFDGLGRLTQTVRIGYTPLGMDLILPVSYDAFGREAFKYLPYARSIRSGQYVSGALSAQGSFYQNAAKVAHDGSPFQRVIFESSPLNRPAKTGAPGDTWQPNTNPLNVNDKSVKKTYRSNEFGEIILFQYDAALETISVSESPDKMYYPVNSLFKTITLDEHNRETVEFMDTDGHMVCKKIQLDNKTYAITYYIYDDFGNLVVSLPPESVKKLTE